MPKLTQAHIEIIRHLKQHKLVAVDKFMQIAIEHYYTNHEPFGEMGDFITAPETSQMFGEMIGVWAINIWSKLNLGKFSLVEIGGGRGLLMKDLLRATKHVTAFNQSLEHLYLVETSDRLMQVQKQQIQDPRAVWVSHIEQVPKGNMIIIANEFFDALPIKQYKRDKDGWKEIVIINVVDKFEFSLAPNQIPMNYNLPVNSVLEVSKVSLEYARQMAEKIVHGAMLIIDYGYLEKPYSSTIQAVKNHKFHDVLQDIGNVDLTAHVDFAELIKLFDSLSLASGITSQGEFLLGYGIGLRAKKLIENGAGEKEIMNQLNRLVHLDQMGELFKVLEVIKV